MTAESAVPSPGGQPREYGFSPVSVIPPRGAVGGFRFPAGQRTTARPASWLPLVAVDGIAALATGQALSETQRHPLLVVALLLGVVGLNTRASLYLPEPVPAVLDELPAVCARIVVTWCTLAALLAALSPAGELSARTLAAGCALQSAVSCAGRGTVHWRRRRALVLRPSTALVIGPAATAQRVSAAFLRHPGCGVRPVGIVADQPAGGEGLPVLTTVEEVQRALIQNSVRAVLVVEPPSARGPLLRALAEAGCALWEVDADSSSYDKAGHHTLAGFSCRRLSVVRRRGSVGKRLLDVAVSGTLLLLVSPLLLVCAVALRLSDGPGVVFKQERIGKDGRPFTLLKFRTHRPVDAHEAATRWSVANEREMSPFCHFLRRTSLDELLQLWNVFWGDMSLVGPRPERPYFVGKFSQAYPGYAARHRMQTGITGLAQIHGLRGDTSIEDRCRFDNAYIDNWSLWQDICILLRTAAALVRSTGS
ncbi:MULTISPECIES: exopolysaccharide biosynthesis polyprenyl glycosylphosphotransferase [unclassified Streptomyces]|uniref:exopolysaccharide biosynthesis polyprenyl glycosylphosphotransferase n=1 Tax=unclassified Streptomyces TaxID=2593676 RepID=UPI002E820C77|nr:exopolysaccharide biosynthesis polyprenyl glycosylphosphotransferase [Streptomyces sp. NBC_00589]WTI39096.1 exopolysaccharide biosynthesis polyprenyl glycosylphosphotransferase [Streptomyces sp. NBC_00775]WUB27225.1 exopolysaccharide biosynthesis polyprenyl glycosylphosphotransferase [Streptomyces sp. NBC_00589]